MRMRRLGVGATAIAGALCALTPGVAAALPATGPRERIDQSYTATRPNAPTGATYTASYHAAGKPKAPPPAMRRMVFYPPHGFRYDTTVPKRCIAPDFVLQVSGPAACPKGSRLGSGKVEGLFLFPFAHQYVFDHYHHDVSIFNGANQQIILVKSEGYTVVRGHFRPDGSLAFAPTSCFPASPTGRCADDYILQLKTLSVIEPYTRKVGGRLRSYATTPRRCPRSGHWHTTVRFWWANGAVDTLTSNAPCTR